MRKLGTAVAITIALLSGVRPDSAVGADIRYVPLGFTGRLTEPTAQSALQGAQLALSDANELATRKHLDIRFRLLPQDDRGNENFAINIARYYIKENVAGVVGPWSSDAALATAELYERAHIPQIGFTATVSKLTSSGRAMPFRVVGGTSDLAAALAEVAMGPLQGRRILVIQNDSAYSMALADAFVEKVGSSGAASVTRFQAGRQNTDFSAALKAAAQQEADVIVFVAMYPQVRAFLDAARRAQSTASILLTAGATNLVDKPAGDGQLYVLEFEIPQDHCPRWKAFSAAYTRQFKSTPTTYSYYAYDAASVLTAAILKSGAGDGEKIAQALHQDQYAGLHGPIRFDAGGANAHPRFTLYRFQGQWRPVQYFPAAAGRREKCQ
ncbi:branched-chain amino acid ABC transporter substrate-binding protein [Herbaspirillum sp. NPDC087042]|uniref:branched-chain amino acid ABC transporter substrate-binding protein n=1 Tax=Herbaspirillum sp. NPDC087042 TaxID=3364004 RepID=UPI003803AC6A